MKIFDGILQYKGYHGRPARCDLRVYAFGMTKIVVAAQPVDYDGLSVTNGIERIANAVMKGALEDVSPSRVIWVQHYPKKSRGYVPDLDNEETWDLVTFFWRDRLAGSAHWRYVTREWVEILIGEKF